MGSLVSMWITNFCLGIFHSLKVTNSIGVDQIHPLFPNMFLQKVHSPSAMTQEFQQSRPRNWPKRGSPFRVSVVELCGQSGDAHIDGRKCILQSVYFEYYNFDPVLLVFLSLFVFSCQTLEKAVKTLRNGWIWSGTAGAHTGAHRITHASPLFPVFWSCFTSNLGVDSKKYTVQSWPLADGAVPVRD